MTKTFRQISSNKDTIFFILWKAKLSNYFFYETISFLEQLLLSSQEGTRKKLSAQSQIFIREAYPRGSKSYFVVAAEHFGFD